ncbi:MAG: glycosyltransferase family 4 protein [Propionibacteriaceae bacterium]|nr:glycosyltransferase family 4 protein [Propionibacteriaceae bacterium]
MPSRKLRLVWMGSASTVRRADVRVLYIDHYAGSPTAGMEYRPHAMAVEWARLGVETTIVAGTFSHLRKRNFPDAVPGRPYDIDGVEFRFLPTRTYEGNGVGRVLSMVEFVGRGWLAAARIARELEPDAVISSSTYPFDTYFAQRVAALSGAVLVHEVHDLWPMTPIELGGNSPRHPLMWAMAVAEKSAYRNSDAVVSILPNVEPHVRGLGIGTPVIPIPNGIDPDTGGQPADDAFVELVDGLHSSGRKVIGYAGGMTHANAMDDFIEAMGHLSEEPVTAVLIGDGLFRRELEARAAALGAQVLFFGMMPKAQVHDALSRCDALYIGSKASPLYEFGVSANKIFDYMLTGVPIVNAFASEHSPMVYADCTVRADAENPRDIARAIQAAVDLPTDTRRQIAEASTAWVREHHALSVLASEFLEVLSHRDRV